MTEKNWYTTEEAANKIGCSIRTLRKKIAGWKENSEKEEQKKLIQKKGRGGKLQLHKKLVEGNFSTTKKTESKEPETKQEITKGSLAMNFLTDRIEKLENQLERKDEQIGKLQKNQEQLTTIIALLENHPALTGEKKEVSLPKPTQTAPPNQGLDRASIIVAAIIVGLSLIVTMIIAGP